ncbi:FimV/HubP family polar landmark protein, partial [Zhongshania sp.]|uniref:FimV/HubP family polar landmark protein n=1 Tax=Zhongshania sp. TaxID=1971902 RepID=UPI0039E57927
SEFDMDLSDTLDTSALSLDAATESDELDLELSDFDMPSEFSSASEVSSTADELDVDVDESFFVDDDLELDDSAVPTDDMKVDSGSTADKQKVAAGMPVVETPAPGAPIVDADTVNIDGDAIAIEDLVFDEFDAGEDDAEGFDSLLDSESVGTKLDLARAYIDMGDSEGAREMLEEVRQEGDTQQQADAQTLLDNIG